jgi:hypothetical protein
VAPAREWNRQSTLITGCKSENWAEPTLPRSA